MIRALRHQQILNQLEEKGSIQIKELVGAHSVSTMTLWRDLRELEEQGLVLRVRGGIMLPHQKIPESLFEMKTEIDSEKKAALAREAASLIRAGDIIALEGGTTVGSIVPFLPHRGISVITNSLIIALQIRKSHPDLPVEVPGGWVSSITGNTTGPDSLKWITKREVSLAFLGATAFHPIHGPMDPNPLEIEVKRAFQSIAMKTVMMLDASKFRNKSLGVTLHPQRIDLLLTNQKPPKEIMKLLKKNRVQIKIV